MCIYKLLLVYTFLKYIPKSSFWRKKRKEIILESKMWWRLRRRRTVTWRFVNRCRDLRLPINHDTTITLFYWFIQILIRPDSSCFAQLRKPPARRARSRKICKQARSRKNSKVHGEFDIELNIHPSLGIKADCVLSRTT